jgi:hypothetical protein
VALEGILEPLQSVALLCVLAEADRPRRDLERLEQSGDTILRDRFLALSKRHPRPGLVLHQFLRERF